jgi:hypothetical protein
MLGLIPDFEGIYIADRVMTINGNRRIDVAAAIAIQSEWINPLDFIDTGDEYHGMGIAKANRNVMYGVQGDPRNISVAIEIMTARIDSVTRICNQCSAFDKLVASAMAQNGPGFDADAMQLVIKYYQKSNGSIDWEKFFGSRQWADDFSTISGWKGIFCNIRAFGRENYSTRYMIYLYALNLYTLYLGGWELPYGITVKDLFAMMALGWGTNQEKHEYGHNSQK